MSDNQQPQDRQRPPEDRTSPWNPSPEDWLLKKKENATPKLWRIQSPLKSERCSLPLAESRDRRTLSLNLDHPRMKKPKTTKKFRKEEGEFQAGNEKL